MIESMAAESLWRVFRELGGLAWGLRGIASPPIPPLSSSTNGRTPEWASRNVGRIRLSASPGWGAKQLRGPLTFPSLLSAFRFLVACNCAPSHVNAEISPLSTSPLFTLFQASQLRLARLLFCYGIESCRHWVRCLPSSDQRPWRETQSRWRFGLGQGAHEVEEEQIHLNSMVGCSQIGTHANIVSSLDY